jgi:hypothetical protein
VVNSSRMRPLNVYSRPRVMHARTPRRFALTYDAVDRMADVRNTPTKRVMSSGRCDMMSATEHSELTSWYVVAPKRAQSVEASAEPNPIQNGIHQPGPLTMAFSKRTNTRRSLATLMALAMVGCEPQTSVERVIAIGVEDPQLNG